MCAGHSELAASDLLVDTIESDVRDCCTRYLAESLHLPANQIDPHMTFARLGVDSATSVFLLMELEERLAVELPPEILYEHVTIAQLARHIARYCSGEATREPRRS